MERNLVTTARPRQRLTQACEPCRKRKIRCDRNRPCRTCERLCRECTYSAEASQSSLARTNHGVSKHSASETSTYRQQESESQLDRPHSKPTNPGTWLSCDIVSVLIDDVPAHSDHSTRGSRAASKTQSPRDSVAEDQGDTDASDQVPADSRTGSWLLGLKDLPYPIRRLVLKNRHLGRSHWSHTCALVPFPVYTLVKELNSKGEGWNILQECKSLGKSIKSQWTCELHISQARGGYSTLIPARHVADKLVDAYLRTFERVYRILHVPSFEQEYEGFWKGSNSSLVFNIKVQLCMAIGACFHDETFSLRKAAIQWVYEASTWLTLAGKSKLTISGLQVMCLLHLACKITGREEDIGWISAGLLLRTAMLMGLHVDPNKLPGMSVYEAQMRRRLWMTILEFEIESCMNCGTSPTISIDDYDCQPPSNLHDHQLKSEETPIELPRGHFTDTSIQIGLGRSIGIRIAIAKLINGPSTASLTYERASQLSSELTEAYGALGAYLRMFKDDSVPLFPKLLCEMIMQRCFIVLHVPFCSLASSNPSYLLSQKICIDTALRISHSALDLSSSASAQFSSLSPLFAKLRDGNVCQDYIRLHICGAGPFRFLLMQCLMIIASDLANNVREKTFDSFAKSAPSDRSHTTLGFGGSIREMELHILLQAGTEWTERRIRAGETNSKNHTFSSLLLAHIEAIHASVPLEESLNKRCLEILRHAADILKEINDKNPSKNDTVQEDSDCRTDDRLWLMGDDDFEWDELMCLEPA
ncbi:hypothetical protein F5X96DRAFT_199173 [Biscogniauxia mediterranea]|nr:hypothetical protein F5X96DRAFT_199173 [Biscogniauxia mediterranea]